MMTEERIKALEMQVVTLEIKVELLMRMLEEVNTEVRGDMRDTFVELRSKFKETK